MPNQTFLVSLRQNKDTQMQKIIGRTAEKAELQDIYKSGKPELVVVYGRRRVGKTFLIREFFKGQFAFYHTGLSLQEVDTTKQKASQLLNFASSLRHYGKTGQKTLTDWLTAFDDLRSLLEEKMRAEPNHRQVVFIDELPWMDTPRSCFLPALEHFWNGWGAGQDSLVLIVCGSATAWISDHLLHNKGGLYDRKTREIKLHPFTLHEAELYYHEQGIALDRYAQMQLYMMLGGIPYYMSYLCKGDSVEQAMNRLFVQRNAKLSDELEQLFVSLFTNHQDCMKIVRLLSTRKSGYTRKEIAAKTGVPYGGGLTKTLKALAESDFIQKYVYYGLPAKEERFRLIDFYSLFVLTVVRKKVSPDADVWQGQFDRRTMDTWYGFAFESLCWNHIPQIKQALGIPSVHTVEFSWRAEKNDRHPGAQIDLLIRRADRIINLCEMKFCVGEYVLDHTEATRIRNKVAIYQQLTRCKETIHPTMVTTYGLVENKYSQSIQRVITMDDLFAE